MSFLYPAAFWGLSFIAVPIFIHLFNLKRQKTLYFSSLQFISSINKETKGVKKLKDLITLIIRILTIIAFVLAFSRPTLKNNISSTQTKVIAIYIDNSFSMSKFGKEGALLSQAKEHLKNTIKKGNRTTQYIIFTNNFSSIEQNLLTNEDAYNQIDKITHTSFSRTIPEVVNFLKESIQVKNILNSQLYIYSDFQKPIFNPNAILDIDSNLFITPLILSPSNKENISIDSVWFSSNFHKHKLNTEINLTLSNHSNTQKNNTELSFQVEGSKRNLFIDLPANKQTSFSFSYIEAETKKNQGFISVNDKDFQFDDTYFFNYEIIQKIPILIINGDKASKQIEKVYQLDPFYSIESVDIDQINTESLSNKNLIILNGVSELSSGLTENLVDFQENGNSIMIFPSDMTKDETNSFNTLLNQLKLPSLGLPLETGLTIKSINNDDRFFEPIFDKKPTNLNQKFILKLYNLIKTVPYTPFLTVQNGAPLFLKSTQTNSYLFTSSLSKNFSNFTSSSLFPTLLLRVGELSITSPSISYMLGKSATAKIRFNKFNKDQSIHIKDSTIDIIPLFEQRKSVIHIDINSLSNQPLIKAKQYNLTSNNEEFGSLSLNYNRNESNTNYFSKEEIESYFNKNYNLLKTYTLEDSSILIETESLKVKEFWKHFIILGIIFILLELLVLKDWKSKKIKEKAHENTY